MKKNQTTTEVSKTTAEATEHPTLLRLSTTESKWITPGAPVPPSPNDIRKAIETLAAAQLQGEQPVLEGTAGDVFLLYDLCVRAHGRRPYRVKGQIALHAILTDTGMPDAPSEIEKALQGMIRPLRTYGLSLVGEGSPPPVRQDKKTVWPLPDAK